jgi:non-ribosomal peptide synthetase component F
MVSAGNVAQMLGVLRERYRPGPEDRISQFFELSFDLSVFDLFMAWGAGATLCTVPDTARMTPARFIREHALTVWFSVPSTAAFMLRVKALDPGAFPTLRLSLFCGEPLPAECAERWRAAAPQSRVENLYGPTEATVACLVAPCSDEVPVTPGRGSVAIGQPLPGTHAAVVDAEGSFLPAGETGELALAGAQVTPGYWRDPELTAERYPVLEHPDYGRGVWYLTGDLARQDPGGDFHHLGRLDHQVKIQGHRVELEEIEAHLRAACGGEAGVVAWPLLLGGSAQGTVAFVSGTRMSAAEIPATLASRLPAYMVPRRVIEVESLPLTPNGKLDRKALLATLEEEGRGAGDPL